MTIADYCSAFDRGEVVIDKTYQRSAEVWPNPARSYLIETILKSFPIPKLALHQVTDLKSRKTIKYVVDGQQRTMAIRDFFADRLRLSRSLELTDAAGRLYSNLEENLQENFLAYSLVFDQFEAATDEDVREYFRRINSYTAPLTAEEQRHARFQGPMKWFVHRLTSRWSSVLVELAVLTRKGSIRMADTKLLAELVHALIYGITTTNKRTLDKMYAEHDKGDDVKGGTRIKAAIDDAMNTILGWSDVHSTALMRMNVFYALVLAVIRVSRGWSTLPPPLSGKIQMRKSAVPNLLRLAEALDDPDSYPEYEQFTTAAGEKTNVKGQRETRVRWLVRAMSTARI